MSDQPAPTRPWFRLASISRPAPQAPTPTPEPPPAPPRPAAATVRPAFRSTVQVQPPTPVGGGGVSSVPTSPVSVGRASQPSSPSDKKTTIATTSSVPDSPVKTVPTATAPGPTAFPPKASTTAALVPSSPAKTAPTTTSVTSSPTQKPAASFVTTTTRVLSPKPTTTTIKPEIQSPIQSPKIKPLTAPPPSPLTLPPPQLIRAQAELEPKIPVEAEQKTVLVQKTIDKPSTGSWVFGGHQKDGGDSTRKPSIVPLNHEQKGVLSKNGDQTKEKGHGKKFPSKTEDDAGTSVITLAGENKGAFMELIRSSPQKIGFQGSPNHLQKRANANSYRIGSDGSDYQSYSSSSGSSSGEEGVRKMKDKSKTSSKTMAPMNVFMNSNVQGVNNSILYNSPCTHHDPGVHLSLYTKSSTGGGFHVKERTKGYSS